MITSPDELLFMPGASSISDESGVLVLDPNAEKILMKGGIYQESNATTSFNQFWTDTGQGDGVVIAREGPNLSGVMVINGVKSSMNLLATTSINLIPATNLTITPTTGGVYMEGVNLDQDFTGTGAITAVGGLILRSTPTNCFVELNAAGNCAINGNGLYIGSVAGTFLGGGFPAIAATNQVVVRESTNGTLGYASSSITTKDLVGDVDETEYWRVVDQLHPVKYTYKADPSKQVHLGYISEWTQAVDDSLAPIYPDGSVPTISHLEFVTRAMMGMQLLRNQNLALSQEVSDLKELVADLATRITQLEG